jgi:hypothetical protein
MHNDSIIVSSKNLERKSSYPLNKKTNRHVTNDSLISDAYDNYPEKNGYDNYPLIRKPTQNESEGRFLLYFDLFFCKFNSNLFRTTIIINNQYTKK